VNFETSKAAAERLSVTPRAIQKWAKEGKIPHAHKVGRDWMIPTDATPPSEAAQTRAIETESDFPFIFDHKPGEFAQHIKQITNKDAKAIAQSEYYYFIGELKSSSIVAEPYLTSKDSVLRSTTALFCVFANLCRGHLHKSKYAVDIIMSSLKDCFDNNAPDFVKAVNVLTVTTLKIQLHLSLDDTPPLTDYIKHLPEDLKMFAFYLMAYIAYMNKDYSGVLGITQTALSYPSKEYPISFAYLYIVAAVAHINLHQTKDAEQCIEKAWQYIGPDELYMPFVEHYLLMQGVIERYFKKQHPQAYNKILNFVKQYNLSWYVMHNDDSEFKITQHLTPIEFTVAMLYSRNWRAKQIANHLELSERTVMNYIQIIYQKLHTSSKKELEKYVLK